MTGFLAPLCARQILLRRLCLLYLCGKEKKKKLKIAGCTKSNRKVRFTSCPFSVVHFEYFLRALVIVGGIDSRLDG